MRSQRLKDLYYMTLGRLSIVSLLWRRCTANGRYLGAKVNLGCGPKYIEGMVNVDGNIFRRKDLWLDVTLGLPFPDNSLRAVYSSHLAEHLEPSQLRRLLAEIYRSLRPGGVLRLVVPSLEYAVAEYEGRNGRGLPDWPRSYRSPGGRFNNFLLCDGQHRLMFDFSFLEEFLKDAGFDTIERSAPLQSRCFSSNHMDHEKDPALIDRSLYVECDKPAASGAEIGGKRSRDTEGCESSK